MLRINAEGQHHKSMADRFVASPINAARLAVALGFTFLLPNALAQTDTNAQPEPYVISTQTVTPIPGSGHDYLHDLSETVNPANGALSIRITAFRPKERAFNYPIFSFLYDSTNQFTVQMHEETLDSATCAQAYPMTSGGPQGHFGVPPFFGDCIFDVIGPVYTSVAQGTSPYPTGPNSLAGQQVTYTYNETDNAWTCSLFSNLVYEDAEGVVHNLDAYGMNQVSNENHCNWFGIVPSPFGGDEEYKVVVADQMAGTSSNRLMDLHGNSLNIAQANGLSGGLTGGKYFLYQNLEDTNGNFMNASGRSGQAYSFQPWGEFGSAIGSPPATTSTTYAGNTGPHTYTWGNASATFIPNVQDVSWNTDNLCASGDGPFYGTNPVVTNMLEPNGLSYSFTYEPVFGLLNKITYPTGAWVEYTWGVNPLSEGTGWTTPAQGLNQYVDPVALPADGTVMNTECAFRHDTPAIKKRVVSYDGVHPAMEQDLTYSTAWGTYFSWLSKTTTVVTKDLLTPGTPQFTTTYVYAPLGSIAPPFGSHSLASQLPVEFTINYQDTNGNKLKTVQKTWNGYRQMSGECVTLYINNVAGPMSGTFYQYASYSQGGLNVPLNPDGMTTPLISDKAEYDFGTLGNTCSKPTNTTPTRETVTAYATLANTPALWPQQTYYGNPANPQNMPDRPSTIKVYYGGTLESETDYSYDQTSLARVTNPTGHDESNFLYNSTNPRGNPTTVTKKCFILGVACTNSVWTLAYDATGQVVSITDPRNNTTTVSYADSYLSGYGSAPGNTNTYPTTITKPVTSGVSHIQKFAYQFNNGQLGQSTDENSQVTSYLYADPWNRLTTVNYPDTGQTSYQYSDAGPSPSVTTTTKLSSSVSSTSVKTMDAYGHVTQTALTSDSPSPTYVVTSYDGFGRVSSVTNPYRSTSDLTYGKTLYTYDAMNRPLTVTHPDSTILSYTYAGRATQETDESGIVTTSQNDALGRVTSVCEQSSTPQQGGPSQDTTAAACGQDIATNGFVAKYAYDGLDNLTSVTQGSLPNRSFVYDSLSRLVCAYNPEYGASTTSEAACPGQPANTAYTYDANGNVTSRSRWAPNQSSTSTNVATTSYTYDALNRVLSATYADSFNSANPTPPAAFVYDVGVSNMSLPSQGYLVGRLSAAYTTNTAGQFVAGRAVGYDKMGRENMMAECTVDDCVSKWYYELTYGYDLNGNDSYQTLTTTDNNSTFTLNYTYNAVNQLTTMTSTIVDSNHPGTLLSGAVYSPMGGLASANLGNGTSETLNYDVRGRLACDTVVKGSTTLYNLGLSNATGACSQSGFSSGTTGYGGNGDVLKYVDSLNGTWTNTYDDMNRLHTATQAAGVGPLGSGGGTMSWTYDRFGNRWSQAQTGVTTQQFNFTGGNNRINGYTYDAVGNLLYDGVHTYTYDDENRILTATLIGGGTETYSYDADGRRIRKTNGTTPEEYVYDKDGNQIGEMMSNGTFNRIELYAGNHHVVTYDNVNLSGPSARAIFIHDDWLGTERARSLYDGTLYQTCTNLPFGDQQTCLVIPGYSDPSPLHLTGKMRDTETNLDYFGARYYGSSMGRFLSSDWSSSPEGIPYVSLEDPQSLNLYSYVLNNPLSHRDLDGHSCDPDTWDPKTNTLTAGACHPEGTLQSARRWLGQHPKTVKTVGYAVMGATAISGLFDAGASELAIPEELAAEEALLAAGEEGTEIVIDLSTKPVAESPELQSILDELYQPGDSFPGGTAGAARQELATSENVGGKPHFLKAIQRARQLEKGLANGTFKGKDAQIAKAVMNDLRDAVTKR